MRGDRIDDAGERVLLEPDLDVAIGARPQALAIERGGVPQRVLDAVERARLALPAGVVGEPVVGQFASPAHDRQIGLHLGVTALGLLDEAAHGGLVEHLPDGHRPAVVDDGEQRLAAFLDLGLGGADALYVASLINAGGHAAGSLARSSIRSSARTGTRKSLPILIVGMSPRAAAS